ncbi:MAG: Ig-like domain-containing protein [Muribaculaceae bacterium]|nr:Ig-like domain-containing protein [Muribaculaceae bacterium]
MMRHTELFMRLLSVGAVALLFAACASMGRPEGGPRDETPPVFVGSKPAVGAMNVSGNRITIDFDENIQIDDPSNKVVISPVQKEMPSILANGKRITVQLRDTLLPATTYTIDFTDAVKDLNEGNMLDGFAIDFSTGETIDTLCISGMVLEARNLEPAQGMLVGVYSNLADSAIKTLPLERISKTNQLGQFSIRNLKPGTYRIFALKDMNRDFHWDRSEDVAFYDVAVSPDAVQEEVADTLVATDGSDSIVTRQVTRLLPDDVLLTWFNEGYIAQYLKNSARADRRRIKLDFAAPSDTFPEIMLLNGERAGSRIDEWALLNSSVTRDTLEYWIRDTAVMAMDTLVLAVRYMRTDTLQQLTWGTDTLKLVLRGQAKKEKKEEKKKKKSDNIDADTVPQLAFIDFRVKSQASHDVYAPLLFVSSQPVDTILDSGVTLEVQRDTLWDTVPQVKIMPHPSSLLSFGMSHEWEPGAKYRLTVDSAAVVGIYNEWNKDVKHEFTVRQLEDYATLIFNLGDYAGKAVVELLGQSDAVVATAVAESGSAIFRYVNPGTYYARLIVDANGNGKYDTGNLSEGRPRQPEEVYYYPKKISVKKNWDIEQTWNVYELPLDAQKPSDIKKNKPKLKPGETDDRHNHDDEEDEDAYDPFNYGSGNPQYNRSHGNQINNRTGGAFRSYHE